MQRVVLVHGAWHGSWVWAQVTPVLQQAGLDVAAVDLPSALGNGGLWDDAAVLRETLTQDERSTVVVGHSYGGMVVSEAASGLHQVSQLVYLSAPVLQIGESLASVLNGLTPPYWDVDAEAGLIGLIDPATVFYGDLDPEAASTWTSQLTRQSLLSTSQPQRAAAWDNIDSTYITTTKDQAFPVEVQHLMAHRTGRAVEIATSHSPFASAPAELAALLLAAARPRI